MRPVRSTSVVLEAMLFLALAMTLMPSAQAEDLSRRWQLGGSISWQSTQDSIRSNAAFALFDELGDDNIPNTGDEEFLFLDPRPDALVERETSVDDDFRLDLLVAYGIKPWLSVQLDASYFSTDLIQLDTFVSQTRYVDNGDQCSLTHYRDYQPPDYPEKGRQQRPRDYSSMVVDGNTRPCKK